MKIHTKYSAFTLIELLVSLAIFAVMATAAYSGLNQMLKIKEKNEEHQVFLNQIQNTYLQLKKDFFYITVISNRDEYGQSANSFDQLNDSLFEFSSANRQNPLDLPQSKILKLKYSIEDKKLIRSFNNYFNLAPNSKLKKRILLNGIELIEVRFLDNKNTWQEQWPGLNALNTTKTTPKAVEINLAFEKHGEFTWLFAL